MQLTPAFAFFPQIDPKVAFPRRAQPKVSRRISNRILALRGGCQGFQVSNRALARKRWNLVYTVSSGYQRVAVERPGQALCEITVRLQVSCPQVGSEHPAGGRGKPHPSWEDIAPSVAIFMQVFYLFFKHRWDHIRKSWIFTRDSLLEGALLRSYNLEFMEGSRI